MENEGARIGGRSINQLWEDADRRLGPTYGKVYEILHVCIWYMLTDRLKTFCYFKLSSFNYLLHSYADFSLARESHGESLG